MGKKKRHPQSRSLGVAPVVLAAGASRRLGECKALADLEGSCALEILARAALAFEGCAPLVLAGAHAQEIKEALPAGCELLINPAWEEGRTGSLALAAAARPGWDLALLPVDVPRVPESVCRDLAAAWKNQGSPAMGWLAPRFQGRFGHPVLFGRDLARRLLRFGPDQPLSELRQAAEPLLALETPCAAVLEDLDTPLDLARLRRKIERDEENEGE